MLGFVALVRAIVTFSLPSNCLLVQIDRSKTSPLLLLVHVVHQFPLGTWVEHHAVRSNGKFLVTLLTTPDLFQVDPREIYEPQLIPTFSGHTSLLDIAVTYTNTFYVVAANLSIGIPITAVPGSSSVRHVDMKL